MPTKAVQGYKPNLKSLVESVIQLSWNSGRYNLLQQFVTRDYVYHNNFMHDFKNYDEFVDLVKEMRNAMPDLDVSIEELMVEDNKAISVCSYTGTFENPMLGFPPSNLVISFVGSTVWEFRRGRLCSQHTLVDAEELRRQLTAAVRLKA